MQRLKMSFFVLTAVLLFVLLAPAAAFAEPAGETTASVEFQDGIIEMLDSSPEKQGMDINFGVQTLPAGEVEYESTNGPHTLRVSDARSTSTAWTMTVAASDFLTTDPVMPTQFQAIIELTEKSSADIPELTCTAPVVIATGAPATSVLSATASLGRGIFDTDWASENVLLQISASDYQDVQTAEYEATLTWTLIID